MVSAVGGVMRGVVVVGWALLFILGLAPTKPAHSDTTPPTLTEFSISPSTVDTTSGPATVTINYSATDDLSGPVEICAFFACPGGCATNIAGCGDFGAATNPSGSLNLHVPQYASDGTYIAYNVWVQDNAGNTRQYDASALASLGFDTGFTNCHPNAPCNDSNACTYNDTCSGSGQCVGTAITCTSDQCNTRTCNGTSSCTVSPNLGASCNDSNA